MAQYTLYTDTGNFRAFKILIAAEYNGIDISIPEFKAGQDNKTPAFLAKSPLGRVPVLDTPMGPITESNAIARYVARLRQDTGLYGANFFESAQVDSWIDFSSHDIELSASVWVYPVIGIIPYNASAAAKAKADLGRALGVLESHLEEKTYLVGHKITLADITVASALVYPYKFVMDPAYRAQFPNVMRWFTTCVAQPQFEAVIGAPTAAVVEITTGGAAAAPPAAAPAAKKEAPKPEEKPKAEKPKEDKPKKEKAKKEEKPKEDKPKEEKKKAKPKEEEDDGDDEPEPEKKAEHPFKIMDATNKSPFSMDTWKKTYSNCSSYEAAMDEFWGMYDPAGWSIFRGDYNYNDELKVLFMTSNLIGGFIQRTEEIRKWLFGTMTIRGVEGEGMKVTAYFIIRGDSIDPLISCNDDAACYTWTKMVTPPSAADKQLLFDYWTSELPLEGEPNLDSRCYK